MGNLDTPVYIPEGVETKTKTTISPEEYQRRQTLIQEKLKANSALEDKISTMADIEDKDFFETAWDTLGDGQTVFQPKEEKPANFMAKETQNNDITFQQKVDFVENEMGKMSESARKEFEEKINGVADIEDEDFYETAYVYLKS